MKILVFVLVLANLLFFAYTRGYFGRPENPDAGRLEQQLNPDRIRILARGEPPAVKNEGVQEAPAERNEVPAAATTPAPAQPAAAVASQSPAGDVCVAWPDLTSAEANQIAGVLEAKFSDFKVERRAVPGEGSNWWVFIPPLPSKADAERKVGELKRMGVTDYFIVQDPGPNRFAISLGVFSSETGANEHLAKLRSKGVRSAKAAQRLGKDAVHTVLARGPAARRGAMMSGVRTVLPDIGSQACK